MDTNQTLQIPSEIRTFLEGLLTDAGMTALDAEMKEEMVKELFVRLDNYTTSVIVDNLPPEHLDAFIKLAEEKKPREEIESFLKVNMPNAAEVFAKALMDFRDLYLGNVAVARNAPQSGAEQAYTTPATTSSEPTVPAPPEPAPVTSDVAPVLTGQN